MTFAICLIAALCLVTGNISVSAQSQNASQANDKSLKEIRDKITATNKRAEKFEQEASSLDQEINNLRQNLVSAAQKIQATEADVYEKEDHLSTLDNQEETLKKNLMSRYKQMAKTLAAMQRLSQQPAEMVAYRPDKAINSLRSAGLLRTLHPELKKRAEAIQGDIIELADVRDQISIEREELTGLLSALTAEQVEMNQLMTQRREKQKELRRATRQERKKLKEFASKAKNLQDLIAKIEQESRYRVLREKQEREKAAQAAARRLAEHKNVKPDSDKASTGKKEARLKLASLPGNIPAFRNAKGKLPLPARGAIRQKFGSRTSEGSSSKGITIRTLPQATVVSPHEGRIVFAGEFRSYGQLLIISHGPEYHTLLAGMTRLDAEVGQWVLKGEPIGQMAAQETPLTKTKTASDQKLSGQNLYVELRQMGKPINPLPWIVARDRKVL